MGYFVFRFEDGSTIVNKFERRLQGEQSGARFSPMNTAHILNLLGNIYLCHPTRESVRVWKMAVEPLAGALPNLARELNRISLWGAEAIEELAWEFTRLFIGPYRLFCPPWESVYTSPNRLLMQEAHDEVSESYRQMGLVMNHPHVMPDHIGAELNFAALLVGKMIEGEENVGRRACNFREDHLRRWIPQFTADLAAAADSAFYKALAVDTRNVILNDEVLNLCDMPES